MTMRFVADLHIHSRYSISTSRDLAPESLEAWARRKGIAVVGTGDATHPSWLQELKEKLQPAEEGLYTLRPELRGPGTEVDAAAGGASASPAPRFLVSAEVSTIYRRDGRTRKVHHLILLPDFEAAGMLQQKLSRLGTLTSDGRPVFGLDSRSLLEIVLEASGRACFIPAHIWTPWFSALGDKSGFDSIEECYGDLAGHIYAVETGLSSDPPMNWACAFLDRYALVSNSDAHSAEKLGREANRFDAELSYPGILAALQASARGEPSGFLGTLEFFPQEGKYHYDGHRKCGVCWEPAQTRENAGLCPACGKPVTVGVLSRVAQLASRPLPGPQPPAPPPGRPGFHSLIPLKEILAELAGTGAQSRQVTRRYDELLARAGSELGLLLELPPEEVTRLGGEALGEAVRRMRVGQVRVEPGYDGEYGRITLFAPGEAAGLGGQEMLFGETVGAPPPRARKARGSAPVMRPPVERPPAVRPARGRLRTNPEQKKAVEHGQGPALVLAGPGTGKTATLTERIARLVGRGVRPEHILAVTFTNKAAREMRSRLEALLPDPRVRDCLRIGTFHAFGLDLLKRFGDRLGLSWPFTILDEEEREELVSGLPACAKRGAAAAAEAVSLAKQALSFEEGPPETAELFRQYEATLALHNAVDLDDLLRLPIRLLESRPEVLEEVRGGLRHLLIDEYQDVNAAQYRLVRLLKPGTGDGLFAIGDPDQAIYGFRGADPRFIRRFLEDYPAAAVYTLSACYRCSGTILQASASVLGPREEARTLRGLEPGVRLSISEHASEAAEARFVARTIESLLGGLRMERGGEQAAGIGGLSDFAVLCRVGRQMEPFIETLAEHSIPCQTAAEGPWLRAEPARSVLRVLQALRAPGNDLARARVTGGRIASAEDLEDWRREFEREGNLRALIQRIGAALPAGGRPGEEALRRLVELAEERGGDIDLFLEAALLGTGQDALRRGAEAVSVLTLHAAKGLEFPCVFITGCEDGLLPYTLFGRRPADPEEERRLLYVGMTRARSYLFLTHARRRTLFGREHRLPPSPFLTAITEELAERSRPSRTRGRDAGQLDLFK